MIVLIPKGQTFTNLKRLLNKLMFLLLEKLFKDFIVCCTVNKLFCKVSVSICSLHIIMHPAHCFHGFYCKPFQKICLQSRQIYYELTLCSVNPHYTDTVMFLRVYMIFPFKTWSVKFRVQYMYLPNLLWMFKRGMYQFHKNAHLTTSNKASYHSSWGVLLNISRPML